MSNSIEVWKDVKGYEGLYQVSNLGRVRSLDRIVSRNKRGSFLLRGKLASFYTDKDGYLGIGLTKNKKQTSYRAHRIVTDVFVPNPHNKPEVNHINGIKHDNRAVNLEWSTSSENQKHAFRTGLQKAYKGEDNILSMPLVQLSLSCEYIDSYESAMIAEFETSIPQGNISRNCRKGINYSAGGFRFIYKSDYDSN